MTSHFASKQDEGLGLFIANGVEGMSERDKKNWPSLTDQEDSSGRDPERGSGTQVLTRPKPKLMPPSMYKVILLNDDFTPMDFVVHILVKFFSKTETEAADIMLQVHQQGSGVAGIFTHEVAETKVYLVNDYSRKNRHPLKCIMEPDGQR